MRSWLQPWLNLRRGPSVDSGLQAGEALGVASAQQPGGPLGIHPEPQQLRGQHLPEDVQQGR